MNRSAARMSLLAVALALGAGAATAAELQATVPPRFQGEWAASLKQCGTGDESRLTIEPAHIRFYESRGAIKAVVTQGDSELALIAELSGEGETWLALRHFRLAADQKTLTDVTGEPELVRYRCPKAAK